MSENHFKLSHMALRGWYNHNQFLEKWTSSLGFSYGHIPMHSVEVADKYSSMNCALLMAENYSASILVWDMVRTVFDGFLSLCCPCHNLNSQWENPPPNILLNAWWAGCRWLQMDALVTFQVAWVTGYWHEGGPCCWAAIYANLVSNNSLADRRVGQRSADRNRKDQASSWCFERAPSPSPSTSPSPNFLLRWTILGARCYKRALDEHPEIDWVRSHQHSGQSVWKCSSSHITSCFSAGSTWQFHPNSNIFQCIAKSWQQWQYMELARGVDKMLPLK